MEQGWKTAEQSKWSIHQTFCTRSNSKLITFIIQIYSWMSSTGAAELRIVRLLNPTFDSINYARSKNLPIPKFRMISVVFFRSVSIICVCTLHIERRCLCSHFFFKFNRFMLSIKLEISMIFDSSCVVLQVKHLNIFFEVNASQTKWEWHCIEQEIKINANLSAIY